MASRRDNLKALGKNSRTRVVILFTFAILIGSLLYGYFKLKKNTIQSVSKAKLTSSPSIQSIPGALNQTPQYSALQNKQNIEQAEKALKSGSSAIPTIVSMQKFDGTQEIGPQGGSGGLGFSSLSRLEEGSLKPLWLQNLSNQNCAKDALDSAVKNGAKIIDLKAYCNCAQLKDFGFKLNDLGQVCDCRELKLMGYSVLDLKNLGFNASELRACGYSACEEKAAGFSAAEMKNAGFEDGELKGAGFRGQDVESVSGLPLGLSASDIQKNCSPEYLAQLREKGVRAAAIRRISACSAKQLLEAGFSPSDLKDAGFTASDLLNAGLSPDILKNAGFDAKSLMDAGLSPDDLKAAGYTDQDLLKAGVGVSELNKLKAQVDPNALANLIANHQKACSPDAIKKERAQGMTVDEIHKKYGCNAAELLQGGFTPADLVKAGFTPAELAAAGLSAADLLKAGFSPADLKAAGYSTKDLLAAGVSPKDLLAAGLSPDELLKAGISPGDLLKAGVSPKTLKALGVDAKTLLAAGASPADLKNAGFTGAELQSAGVDDATLTSLGLNPKLNALASLANMPEPGKDKNNPLGGSLFSPSSQQTQGLDQLNNALEEQKKFQAQQKFQQKIAQRAGALQNFSTQLLQGWKTVPTQAYVAGSPKQVTQAPLSSGAVLAPPNSNVVGDKNVNVLSNKSGIEDVYIKTGDIIFAVIDTSVNTDEPGPILATITSGPLKNSKLIGSFNMGANAEKLTMTFNTLSVEGYSKTIGISAYAIDPNTGRTALSSSTDHHYLTRYGSLFASTFLEGFGNAFQSADTQITIGGTGGETNTTVQNGINRSLTDNAVIGLATLGKGWGQQAQKNMSIPTTIQVYSGTPIGVLFLQDVALDEKG
jgi:intracellular multiplication protein IcmE